MRTAIVYTGAHTPSGLIADIVASQAARCGPVSLTELGRLPFPRLEGIELLVVGGPPHLHGTGLATGVIRVSQNVDEKGACLARWLGQLPPRLSIPAAAFDTRNPGLRVMTPCGARGIYRALSRHRCQLLSEPMSFLVAPDAGANLVDGEQERAAAWAAAMTGKAEHHRPAPTWSAGRAPLCTGGQQWS